MAFDERTTILTSQGVSLLTPHRYVVSLEMASQIHHQQKFIISVDCFGYSEVQLTDSQF